MAQTLARPEMTAGPKLFATGTHYWIRVLHAFGTRLWRRPTGFSDLEILGD